MMNKKICLISLPSPYLLVEKWTMPLTLFYLKSYLKKQGVEGITIVDLAGIPNYLDKIPGGYDYYGISFFTAQHSIACEVSAYIKENYGGIIIGGGHHITALPVETLQRSCIDIAVIGEGEKTLFDIVKGKPIATIKGIVYKENDKYISNPRRELCPCIDEYVFPDIAEINFKEYSGMVLDKDNDVYQLSILTSRGCPFVCAFCASQAFWHRKLRFHSAEYVIDVLQRAYTHGINHFRFEDDNFDLNKPRLKKILVWLKKMESSWICGMRSENVSHEVVSMMKESGVREISLGIESGSNKILKLISKNETVETHSEAIRIIKEYGIKIKGFLMSGLPGEDQSTVDETIHFIKTQPVDYFTVSTFTPFPGTEIWKSPERFNYVFNKQESFDNFLMLSKERITRAVSKNSDMVYHFHKQLLEASAERDTGIRSFNVARKRDKVQKWMEEF